MIKQGRFLSVLIALMLSLTVNAVHYYSCDFEDASVASRWILNPTANSYIASQIKNKWYIGELGNNTMGGSKGLYISNDNGASLQYEASGCWSFAYDTVSLDALSGANYQLSFEYRAMGNVTANDGIYAFWIPLADSVTVFSNPNSTMPSRYEDYIIQLQPTAMIDYVNGTSTWKQCITTLPGKLCDGTPHYLVFAWANGAASAHQPGAAIDNIEITDERPCDAPTSLAVSITNGQAVMTWQGSAPAYEVSAYSYEAKKWYGPVLVTGNTYSFAGLPSSETDFVVRAKCDENLYSMKTMLTMLYYNPDELCVDYLNLKSAKCYTGTGFDNIEKFNNFVLGAPVDEGPGIADSRHTVHFDKSETDQRTGNLLHTIPDGELASVRLGNWLGGNQAERIEYSFEVDTINYPVLLLKYAVILEAPTHEDYQNPRFFLDILINGKSLGACASADFNANDVRVSGSTETTVLKPEAVAQGWHVTSRTVSLTSADIIWKEWTTVGVNLKDPAYQGKKLTVRLTTFDCAMSAHGGYAYFTLGCSDGQLKDMKCGEVNPTFNAPDGFNYRWYLAADESKRDSVTGNIPDSLIVSHEQKFEAGWHDDKLYAVDCMFVQDSSCYFTLNASTLATNPVPVASYEQTKVDCDAQTYTLTFDATKSYVQEIDHVTGDTLVSTRHRISYLEWDFGDGQKSYDALAKHTFYASQTQDTTYTVILTTRYMTCDEVDTIHLVLHPVTSYIKTTMAYLCDADKKTGYTWQGRTYHDYAQDSLFIPASSPTACDTMLYLDLREPGRDTINALIFDYESYSFHGQQYTQAGTYYYVSPDCDSAVVLNLLVYETLKAQLDTNVFVACGGDMSFALKYTITKGSSRLYSHAFADPDMPAPLDRQPLSAITGSGEVDLAIPADLEPGSYDGLFTLHDTLPEQDVKLPYRLEVRYPASVLTQRWNDVLAVRNADFNGGYQFDAVQWYVAGQPIEGAQSFNYYSGDQPLRFGEEYYALLTRSDGVKIFTCPFVPVKTDASVDDIPSLVPMSSAIKLQGRGTAQWLDIVGHVFDSQPFDNSDVVAPATQGVYVLLLHKDSDTAHRVLVK